MNKSRTMQPEGPFSVRDARRCRAPLQEGLEGGQFLGDDALSAGCLQGGAELGGFVGGFERPNSGIMKCSDSADVGAGDMIADRAPGPRGTCPAEPCMTPRRPL